MNCSFDGCTYLAQVKDLCDTHYTQQLQGRPLKRANRHCKSWKEALEYKTIQTEHGLEWTGNTNKKGYGRVGFNYQTQYAHRVSYEIVNGPIPEGMELDHEPDCPKNCITTEHLTLRTKAEHAKLGWERGECDGGWGEQSNFARR